MVTTALTYANGPLHLGHMLEYIQVDIWHRSQKMAGREGYFIAGSDAHGTPIMLSAEKNQMSPEGLVKDFQKKHREDLQAFGIGVDTFGLTHDAPNKTMVNTIYQALQENEDIEQKTIWQLYDDQKNMFLPDRFIKGECPKCHALDQYGDNCEACGGTYEPSELINPISVISGSKPCERESVHYFFRLDKYQDFLDQWLNAEHIPEKMLKKIKEWFKDGLKPWDISRDAPYFGFQIPGSEDKYFYVWLDAPVGYVSFFKTLCDERGMSFQEFWAADSQAQLYHCMGKDVFYFHALFWPAMLKGANMRLPSELWSHGFLTINGEKMSKSRGTFILAQDYLEQFHPDYFRYYMACKLHSGVSDIDFNFEEFVQRNNADLVGKFVNIASRCANFIHRFSDGKLADHVDDPKLLQHMCDAQVSIRKHYDNRDTHFAMQEIMALADMANQYIDQHKPWAIAKETSDALRIQAICSQGILMFRLLCIYLKPVITSVIAEAEKFLNIEPLSWGDIDQPILSHTIGEFKPLLSRLQLDQVKVLANKNKQVVS